VKSGGRKPPFGSLTLELWVWDMRSSDIICPTCKAGYRRLEVASGEHTRGEYRCLVCDDLLEVFDGSAAVAIRLTVQPEKILK
jgi:transposase-like protein